MHLEVESTKTQQNKSMATLHTSRILMNNSMPNKTYCQSPNIKSASTKCGEM